MARTIVAALTAALLIGAPVPRGKDAYLATAQRVARWLEATASGVGTWLLHLSAAVHGRPGQGSPFRTIRSRTDVFPHLARQACSC